MSDSRKYYYLKLKDNFFDTDEMIILESMPDGYLYSNILLKLYLRSLKYNGRLMFNEKIPFNSQMLATITRHSIGVIEKSMTIFKELNLVEILDSGAIYMTDMQNFIGESSTAADRKREYRNKIAIEKRQMSRQMSGQIEDKSLPELEIELDIDIELDKDIKQKPKKNPAHQYGEYKNVLLTDDELEKLKAEFPSDWQERIERLSCYIASKGTKYKNHLATIRNWARKDRGEQNAKDGSRHGLPADIATKIRECGLDPNDATDVQYFNSYGKYCYDAKKAGYPPVKEKQA